MGNKFTFLKKFSYMDYIFTLLGIFFVGIFVAGFVISNSSSSNEESTIQQSNAKLRIYEFWGSTCPHCKKANEFFEEYVPTVSGLEWQKYEVYNNRENNKLFEEAAKTLGQDPGGVPFIIIGDEVFGGFGEGSEDLIKDRVDYCMKNECPDSIAEIVGLPVLENSFSTSSDTANLNQNSLQTINVQNFNAGWQKDKEEAILIDLRTPQEYQEGHLEGSKMIDFYNPNFQSELAKLDRSQTYYIYCNSGNRSGEALQMMDKMGFEKVYNLDGGIQAWLVEGLPVTVN